MTITAIVTAYMTDSGYMVNNGNELVSLSTILTGVLEAKGTFYPLGMCQDEINGMKTIACSVYIVVPKESGIWKLLSGENDKSNE